VKKSREEHENLQKFLLKSSKTPITENEAFQERSKSELGFKC